MVGYTNMLCLVKALLALILHKFVCCRRSTLIICQSVYDCFPFLGYKALLRQDKIFIISSHKREFCYYFLNYKTEKHNI